MRIVYVLTIIGMTNNLVALSTSTMQRKQSQPISRADAAAAKFGNYITLTQTEYDQLSLLPELADHINDDNRTVPVKYLINQLLGHYRITHPTIRCIRAPCPLASTLLIKGIKGTITIELPLTDSPFSQIIHYVSL